MEFAYHYIAQATNTTSDEVESILNFIKADLTEEQIVNINKNAQMFCEEMWQHYLDNPEDFGLI